MSDFFDNIVCQHSHAFNLINLRTRFKRKKEKEFTYFKHEGYKKRIKTKFAIYTSGEEIGSLLVDTSEEPSFFIDHGLILPKTHVTFVSYFPGNVSLRGELLEPIIATVRARGVGGVDGRAAVWDPLARRWRDNTSGNYYFKG